MTKHTPGPWGYIAWASSLPLVNRKDLLRTVYQYTIYDAQGKKITDFVDTKANAKLMTAAPEMLEALEAALECGMVPATSAKEGGAASFGRHTHVADMIRSAVAKAKGEQP